jgi:hypothetical protein
MSGHAMPWIRVGIEVKTEGLTFIIISFFFNGHPTTSHIILANYSGTISK